MLRINEITAPLGSTPQEIKSLACKYADVSPSLIKGFEIARESIDSRQKNNIKMIYSVNLELENEADEKRIAEGFTPNKVNICEKYIYEMPENRRTSKFRPIVVGFGPAGMFAGLILAKAGLCPLILERGNDVDTRTKDVYGFWNTRRLNTSSNVQFGEGGAGTFSDGKLTTGIKDSRCRFVLESLYEFGAPESILYSAHPHIGTDKLVDVVKNIREKIISLGGEIRFGCCLTDIYKSNGYIQGIAYRDNNGSCEDLETDCLILCIGHSARDTVEMLYSHGIRMEQKPFSVGVRIEHPQELINKALFGKEWNNPLLGAANYKLANHSLHTRGAYTFCMCPGGTVVCASSEEEMVVVNGMSEFARDKENANSAILVGIEPEHFPDSHPLAGIALQRDIERKAFNYGGKDYTAPAQTVGDFLKGVPSKRLGFVRPSCPTGTAPSDIRKILPVPVTDSISAAITAFDKKLQGFALPDAVLTAPESRSSSPVRIVRDECRQASIKGIFPCGEGAGYAGGIVSAAVDGIKCAEAVLINEEDDC
ncbi:MAG: hypothetical protein E7535_08870 [Ruminococcaceae bacterium]|nr:hypothetical protein [Oscillospiraceae bacterium]